MQNSVFGEVIGDMFEMQSCSKNWPMFGRPVTTVPSKWILEVLGAGPPARSVTVKLTVLMSTRPFLSEQNNERMVHAECTYLLQPLEFTETP